MELIRSFEGANLGCRCFKTSLLYRNKINNVDIGHCHNSFYNFNKIHIVLGKLSKYEHFLPWMTRSRSSTHIFAYVSDGLRINTLCRRSPAHENYTGPTQASCSQSRLNCFTASSPLPFLSETSDSRSMNSLLCDCELSLLLFSKSILFRFFLFLVGWTRIFFSIIADIAY